MSEPESTPPALFAHCVTIYKEMLDQSKLMDVQGESGQETVVVYTGSLTRLFEKVGLSIPYYTHVTRALKLMDCCRQTRRGGGGQPSTWLMLREPTIELYNAMDAQTTWKRGKTIQEQRLTDTNQRLTQMELRVNQLEYNYAILLQKELGA